MVDNNITSITSAISNIRVGGFTGRSITVTESLIARLSSCKISIYADSLSLHHVERTDAWSRIAVESTTGAVTRRLITDRSKTSSAVE